MVIIYEYEISLNTIEETFKIVHGRLHRLNPGTINSTKQIVNDFHCVEFAMISVSTISLMVCGCTVF